MIESVSTVRSRSHHSRNGPRLVRHQQTRIRGERLSPSSVSIHGTRHGFIISFAVRQTFEHAEAGPQELSYIVPNNPKICMYGTTFTIGDEVIKPRIQEKDEAERIYLEAKQEGHAALLHR